MEFRTYHGQIVQAFSGQFVVKEEYKGFLNNVRVFSNKEAATRYKEQKVREDSYKMQRNYHWRIQEVK